MIQQETRRDDLELNMAPMIDMVFLLIIFFLTATTFTQREREQDVLLPTNRNPGSLSRQMDNNIIVNVMKDGSLRVLGRAMSHAELHAAIRQQKERSTVPLKVQIRGDGRAAYKFVAKALEVVEGAGVKRPYIATKVAESGE